MKMNRVMSLLLCLCLAASLVGSLCAGAAAETPPEARDLIILFTSDVHCGIDKGWGYAGLFAIKEKLSADIIPKQKIDTPKARLVHHCRATKKLQMNVQA